MLCFRRRRRGSWKGDTGQGWLVLSQAGHYQADSQGSWGFGNPFALTKSGVSTAGGAQRLPGKGTKSWINENAPPDPQPP